MRYLLTLFILLTLPLPAMAQEAEPQPETAQAVPENRLNISQSLMFQPEALDKFMELYDTHQALAARGEVALVENTVDLNIKSEAEQEIDPEHVVFTLNSILWDKGTWTIWVNGRKHEKKKEGEPILIGPARFHIVSVGRESVTFIYQPGSRIQSQVRSRYDNRDTAKQQFRSVLARGEDVRAEDDGEGYVFTLRPNQNFRTEYMLLTEGAGFSGAPIHAADAGDEEPSMGDASSDEQQMEEVPHL